MQVLNHAPQAFFQHVCVNLCRGNVGVAQQGLYDAQIGAVLQKMTGERVAQHVRADRGRGNTGRYGKILEFPRRMLTREMTGFAE